MKRVRALDGLRGYAALVVVIHHIFLTGPSLSRAYQGKPVDDGTFVFWLSYSPLHIIWAGREAVIIFFVLSGLALALPFTGGCGPRWREYYPRRVLRLGLPALGSLVFAYACYSAIRHPAVAADTWWLARLSEAQMHLTSFTDYARNPTKLNDPLWSLRYELEFSLLLPAYLFVAIKFRRFAVLAAVLTLVLCAVGARTGSGELTFLPVFLLGVLVAFNIDQAKNFVARTPTSIRVVITVAAVLLLTCDWWLNIPHWLSVPVVSAAGCWIITGLLLNGPGQRAANYRFSQWLGRISFSLYLVHFPIIVLVAYRFPHAGVGVLLLVALPITILAGWLFYNLVERGSHQFARRVGKVANGSGLDPG